VPVDPAGRLAVLAAGGDEAAKAQLVDRMGPLVGRLAARLANAEYADPDIEKMIVVDGDADLVVNTD